MVAQWLIGLILALFFIMAMIVLSISLFGAFAVIGKTNTIANEIMRIAEIKGHTAIAADIERIKSASGLTDASITFSCDYISGTNHVQLGGKMAVMVETSATIGIGNIAQRKLPIKSKAVGISEQYWK